MAISIRNPETERLARELARRTGERITVAITKALRERLQREGARLLHSRRVTSRELLVIGSRVAALAVRDTRSTDEILGYDERGLPGR